MILVFYDCLFASKFYGSYARLSLVLGFRARSCDFTSTRILSTAYPL